MKLNTRQFGALEINEDSVITFPSGLLGFEQLHRFLLIDQPEIAPLRWLQSVDEPQIAFTVLDPAAVFEGYQPTLSTEDRLALELAGGTPIDVLVLVTVPSNPAEMTANLLGPLVINPVAGIGRQVVLYDSDYSVRQRLLPEPVAV